MNIVWIIVACLFYIALYLIIEVWYKYDGSKKEHKKGLKKNGESRVGDKNKDRLPPSQK